VRMRRQAHLEGSRSDGRAMTLIELIMVLALLAAVVALAAPSLAPFFRGRALQEEARRLLALTRYARSEAVSSCVPMELWIETQSGLYGLRPQAGYDLPSEKKPIEFTLHDGLRFEVNAADLNKDGSVTIRFQPDGTIDDGGLERVILRDSDDAAMEVAQAGLGRGYELRDVEETAR